MLWVLEYSVDFAHVVFCLWYCSAALLSWVSDRVAQTVCRLWSVCLYQSPSPRSDLFPTLPVFVVPAFHLTSHSRCCRESLDWHASFFQKKVCLSSQSSHLRTTPCLMMMACTRESLPQTCQWLELPREMLRHWCLHQVPHFQLATDCAHFLTSSSSILGTQLERNQNLLTKPEIWRVHLTSWFDKFDDWTWRKRRFFRLCMELGESMKRLTWRIGWHNHSRQ